MAITKDALLKLVALQGSDSALDKLQAEMDRIPKEISALNARLEQTKAKAAEAKAKTMGLEKRKKEKELELSSKEDAARKHGLELNQVKTNEAFKALQHEIDQAKAAAGDIETEILELMEGIDASRREEKSLASGLKAVDDEAKAEIAVLEKDLAELKGRFDSAKAARDEASAAVPPELMRVYSHARSRGKLDAIVPVDKGNCSACRINLSPQMSIEVTKAKSMVVCESCQRILYQPEPAVKPA